MKYYFYNFKKEIFLDDFWLLLVIPDYRKQSACGHVFGININLSPQPRPD